MTAIEKRGIVVLISGTGSNFSAILRRSQAPDSQFFISAVLSNRADAKGLDVARAAGIPFEICPHQNYPSRAAFDQQMQRLIDAYQPYLVVLAGFMRILSDGFVRHYRGRLLNIHPALLPKFKGLNTHQRALEAGESEHGASVHFVSEDLDSGTVIAQSRVAIVADDDAERLAKRVLQQEHRLYPAVIQWFCQGRLALRGEQIYFDDRPLTQAYQLEGEISHE